MVTEHCGVCGRNVRECCRIDCEAQKKEQSGAALAEHAKCWRLGYERLAAAQQEARAAALEEAASLCDALSNGSAGNNYGNAGNAYDNAASEIRGLLESK